MKKKLLFTLVLLINLLFITHYQEKLVLANEIETERSYEFLKQDYEEHLASKDMITPDISPVRIEGEEYIQDDAPADVDVYDDYEGAQQVVFTPESGTVSWLVNIPETGYYNIFIKYFPIEGKSSAIERSVFINQTSQFEGSKNIVLNRVWTSKNEIERDNNGNDIKPNQIEAPRWKEAYFEDDRGYVIEPYLFYFDKGVNTLSLESIKEPMVIDYIEIRSEQVLPTYEETLQNYKTQGYTEVKGVLEKVQAEDAVETSSPTLYPIADRSSSFTEPYHYTKIRLNAIGGERWKLNGDSITWEVDVPKSGLYNISFRAKQNFVRGMYVNRKLMINDKVPFREANNLEFVYDNKWQMVTLGHDGEDFLFYLEEGKQKLSLSVSLGEFGTLIKDVETSITNLNELYREIIKYTGPSPDPYRDYYQLDTRIPNLKGRFDSEARRLKRVVNGIINVSGEQNDRTALINKVIIQLEDFADNPRHVIKRLKEFNQNISALGTWILTVSEQPLTIDYILLHSEDAKLPKVNENFFQKIWHMIRVFIASFTTDYSTIGTVGEEGSKGRIEVWLPVPLKSRDHANVLRQLIDEDFTPNTGINVDLKLVKQEVLLPATLTDQGPDVALSLSQTLPVNYAMRNAVYDLSKFEDYDEVSNRFHPSALVPYEFEGGAYALPEEQYFLMMFYRTDIFEELSIGVPDTWDDVIDITKDLQKHYLDFYLPVGTATETTAAVNQIYATLLYQHGGQFYINDNKQSGFTEKAALDAFVDWTNFFTAYKFPVEASFVNRFRSGEMPIGIAPYNMYNTLSVFAPEIRGDWDFAPVPATVTYDENGNPEYHRDAAGSGLGMVLLNQSKNKDEAWEFMKWLTDKDTQVRYGRELEGVLGAGARYPTANMAALQELPWPTKDFKKLHEQWNNVRGIPQVPGSYMTARNLANAFFETYNNGTNPREALIDYTVYINDEITRKRKEFGLE
ncbi:extracellular solute-binding protein [Mycoplasmatota bacterium]|nr:extracellular solute-binding protein [Mycoplasmatota bacterium]